MGMAIIRKMRRQTAMYWGIPSSDGRAGKQTVLPVEIPVRWQDVQEQITTSEGEEVMSRSKVFPGIDLDVGGFLHLGDEASLNEVTDYRQVDTAYEIIKWAKIPVLNVKSPDPLGDENLRIAWL